MNKEYTFALKFKLTNPQHNLDELVEKLYASNCDDALIGIGATDRIALEFFREADNAKLAMQSAYDDVISIIPDAELIEATPDYVGLTEVANA